MLPENLTRREFIKGLAGVAVAGLVSEIGRNSSEAGESVYEQSQEFRNRIEQLLTELKTTKINHPEHAKEVTLEFKQLIQAIDQYQTSIGAGRIGGIDSSRQALWPILSKIVGGSGEYSDEKFYVAYLVHLSRYLSNFGIVMRATSADWVPAGMDKITRTEIASSFYRINSRRRESVNFEGKTAPLDIYVVSPLVIDGQSSVDNIPMIAHAETDHQNIYINQQRWNKDAGKAYSGDGRALMAPANSAERMRTMLESASESLQDKAIIDMVFIQLLRASFEQGASNGSDFVIKHEAGHVLHAQEPNFLGENTPQNISSNQEREKWSATHQTQTEVRGKIGALLFSEDSLSAMIDIFHTEKMNRLYREPHMQGHLLANRSVQRSIADELLASLDSYGLAIDSNSNISPRNQVLMQIPSIAKDQVKTRKLAHKLWVRYRDGKIPDLKSAVSTISRSEPGEKHNSRVEISRSGGCSPTLGEGLGGASLVVLLIAGLAKLIGRKETVKKNETTLPVGKAVRKKTGKKKH